jgi:chromate transporter
MYVGTITDGIFGGISCWAAMFAPAFLCIWGALPFWKTDSPWVSKLLKGVATAAVGFIFTATIMIAESVAKTNVILCIIVACGSYAILYTKKVSAPLVIFIGGVVYLLVSFVIPITPK